MRRPDEASTPLEKTLLALGLTDQQFAETLGVSQSTLSRARYSVSKRLAARIVDYLDPERTVLNELMLLYPERYKAWICPLFPKESPKEKQEPAISS